MLVNRQTINCAFAFSCKKFALFELADPMRRKIFTQLFLQGAARLDALQVPKRQLCGNLTSIGRMCSNLLFPDICLKGGNRMGRINVLDKFTAEKIAAGEVVERPASVIKELVENAIDAGAKSVTVEIKRGGITYMRVTDNGCGMDSDDAKTAFLRHATSKIKTASDLESIGTLGFRGEALCSIAAVSRTELFTKPIGKNEGTHIVMEGGEEVKNEPAGCPEGTTIVVRDIFYNTPARMKFLKKDAAEAAAVSDVCNKQALSHPNVSVRLIRDGKEVLLTPGDNILKNAVHCVLGREVAAAMTEVDYVKDGVAVRGLTGLNNLSRPNRLMEIFFVNGRCVANKTLYNALAEAYKNELMIGRFPVAVLDIELDAAQVDVNVHPSKTEIKFAFERSVYEALYWAVKNALVKASAPREIYEEEPVKNAYKMIVPPNPPQEQQTIFSSAPKQNKSKFVPYTVQPQPENVRRAPLTVNEIREAVQPYGGKLPVKPVEGSGEAAYAKRAESSYREKAPLPAAEESAAVAAQPEKEDKQENAPAAAAGTIDDFRVIGQLFSTYILIQRGDEFILVDQHAAHERIRYEEIVANGCKADSQLLLMPISVNLTPQERETLAENTDFLEGLGFEVEDFGGSGVIIRSLPADCAYSDGGDLLIETLAVLGGDEKSELTHRRDKAVYTIACRSAIKANCDFSIKEMEAIYRRVLQLEGISTCPHGRPISIKFTKYRIEKMFGRIV